MISNIRFAKERIKHVYTNDIEQLSAFTGRPLRKLQQYQYQFLENDFDPKWGKISEVADYIGITVSQMLMPPDAHALVKNTYKDADLMWLGPRTRYYREQLGWSRGQCEKQLGWDLGRIYKIEDGKILPVPKTVQLIADTFGVEVADLFLPLEGEPHD